MTSREPNSPKSGFTTYRPTALGISRAGLTQLAPHRGRIRLNGSHLSLTPMSPEQDGHATGRIRLLLIGLRMLTLWRSSLASAWQQPGEHRQHCTLATRSIRQRVPQQSAC
jgi:hypothetical protein